MYKRQSLFRASIDLIRNIFYATMHEISCVHNARKEIPEEGVDAKVAGWLSGSQLTFNGVG